MPVPFAKSRFSAPFAYLCDVITRIPGTPDDRLHELFPDQWKADLQAAT